jgi:hypothetical protein
MEILPFQVETKASPIKVKVFSGHIEKVAVQVPYCALRCRRIFNCDHDDYDDLKGVKREIWIFAFAASIFSTVTHHHRFAGELSMCRDANRLHAQRAAAGRLSNRRLSQRVQ